MIKLLLPYIRISNIQRKVNISHFTKERVNFLYNKKDCLNVSQKLTVYVENEEKEDIVIIYDAPSIKVIQIQSVFFH